MVKIPTKITVSYLENAALYYLQRFSSSGANLRRVLERKIMRSAAHWGDDPAQFQPLLDAVMQKMQTLGYVDDRSYADQKVRSLHRQGKGRRVIEAALSAKGVCADVTDQALDQLPDQADQQAAWILARKRRLGPFRPADQRGQYRQKDLAAMGRAGFSYQTASAIIDAEDIERL